MSKRGFSIVELLIVIVVVAIIATVTVVVYNGVKKQAQTASYSTAANQVYDAMLKSNIAHRGPKLFEGAGNLINPDGIPINVCIGAIEDFPATSQLNEGECMRTVDADGAVNSYVVHPLFTQRLRDEGVQAPKNLPLVKAEMPGNASIVGRGISVSVVAGSPIWLVWAAPDMTGCGRGVGFTGEIIKIVKANPEMLATLIEQYGQDWENAITGGVETCTMPLTELQKK